MALRRTSTNMAKNNQSEITLTAEEQQAVIELAAPFSQAAPEQPGQPATVAIPQTDEERAALQYELTHYSRKSAAKMTPEEASAFHSRRWRICLALRGVTHDVATVPIPEREEERTAIEHELENPNLYPPNKPVEVMTYKEANAFYIRRRQMMFALREVPDDTTPGAKDAVRGCCK